MKGAASLAQASQAQPQQRRFARRLCRTGGEGGIRTLERFYPLTH